MMSIICQGGYIADDDGHVMVGQGGYRADGIPGWV